MNSDFNTVVAAKDNLFEIETLSESTKRIMREFLLNYTSLQTRRSYYFDLLSFDQFYKRYIPDKSITDLKREDIIAFRDYLGKFGGAKGSGVSSKTVNRRLACLYALFEYLKKERVVSENPVEFVKRHKVSTAIVSSYMDEELVDRYFSLPVNIYKGSKILERVVCRALFTFGMRVNELVSLKIKNVTIIDGNYSLRYKVKGGKELIRECPENFINELGLYLTWCEENDYPMSEDDYLLRGTKRSRGKMSNRAINYIVEKMAKKVGAKGKFSSHSGRVNTIFKVEKKHGLYSAKDYVGHASVSTTERYREKGPGGSKTIGHTILGA